MIVRDRQGQEYRLQVNGDEDSYFLAKLLYRNSEVGSLQCVFYPPDKLMIGDILIRDDVIHAPEHLGAALLRVLVKPKPIDYRRSYRSNPIGTIVKPRELMTDYWYNESDERCRAYITNTWVEARELFEEAAIKKGKRLNLSIWLLALATIAFALNIIIASVFTGSIFHNN
ncbi:MULTISPECIES: hypothetical protein [unclassified Microcoleus]|uniref:hypothetical protein n=1 Tax=unclassified Microcoleus TaxID=2642155 RepID=UPI002FD64E46